MSFSFMAVVTICADFGAQEIKSVTVSIVSPSVCHEVMGLDAVILVKRRQDLPFCRKSVLLALLAAS